MKYILPISLATLLILFILYNSDEEFGYSGITATPKDKLPNEAENSSLLLPPKFCDCLLTEEYIIYESFGEVPEKIKNTLQDHFPHQLIADVETEGIDYSCLSGSFSNQEVFNTGFYFAIVSKDKALLLLKQGGRGVGNALYFLQPMDSIEWVDGAWENIENPDELLEACFY